MQKIRECWLDARSADSSETDVVTAAFNTTLDGVVVSSEQVHSYEFPSGLSVGVTVSSEEIDQFEGSDEIDIVVTSDWECLSKVDDQGLATAYETTGNDDTEFAARAEDGEVVDGLEYLIVREGEDHSHVPETVLDAASAANLSVLSTVTRVDDIDSTLSRSNGHGEGFMIASRDVTGVSEFVDAVSKSTTPRVDLEPFVVESVDYLGNGTRCCIDVTSLMTTTEGMLVGSTNAGGLFVCAEAHAPPNMTPRPFRVNAGAVHSYVWLDTDEWDYLTEITAGDRLACVDADGRMREVFVGRVLVAERPLVSVTASNGDRTITTVLQDHCHVRLMKRDRETITIPNLEPGDEILGHATDAPQPDFVGPADGIERRDVS